MQNEKARNSIMRGLHNEIGHWSLAPTYQITSDRLWRPKIRIDAAHIVRSCDSFQEANTLEQNGPYGRNPISGLFHTWLIDFERDNSGKQIYFVGCREFF